MSSIQPSFYSSTKCLPYLHNCTQCIDSFCLLLQRHVRKGIDPKDPAILRIWIFLCYRKNPVKFNACVVSQKIAIECISPEAALHLVSTKNCDLWKVQHWKSAIQTSRHSAPAESRSTNQKIGPSQRSRYFMLTKRSATSGDENGLSAK